MSLYGVICLNFSKISGTGWNNSFVPNFLMTFIDQAFKLFLLGKSVVCFIPSCGLHLAMIFSYGLNHWSRILNFIFFISNIEEQCSKVAS